VERCRDAVHRHPKLRFRSVAAADDPKGLENEGVFQHLELRGNECFVFVPHNVGRVSLREPVGFRLIAARFDDITGWYTNVLELKGIRRGSDSCPGIDEA